jgi:hypothetical protein
MHGEEILRLSPRLTEFADITAQDVFTLDSSNIQPEEWQLLAKAILNGGMIPQETVSRPVLKKLLENEA